MRASILLTALALAAAACAVSPEVTPYPADARPGSIDAAGPNSDGGGPGPGPGPDANPMGDAGSPGDALPGTQTIGWSGPFASQTLVPAETLFAVQLPSIDTPVSLVGWGVTLAAPSDTQVRMALYTDDGGMVGTLVTWTEAWPIIDGMYPDDGEPLPAGSYWLVLLVRDDVEIGQQADENVGACLQDHAFAVPFDTNFVPASCTALDALNIYILVQ